MFCIQVPMSEMSCPAMNSWKLRCCIARKRVEDDGKRGETAGLTAVRSLFKIFFLPSLDAKNRELATMPREETNCQCSLKEETNQIVSLRKRALFVRRLRRSAYVQMAQVTQRGFVFFAHTPREIRIIQMLIARRLRHIFQHAQSLLDGPLAVRWQLLPLRQYIILNVLTLLRCKSAPHLRALLQFLPLRGRQFLQTPVVLQDFLLFPWT